MADFQVCKTDDARHTVYGWASVSIKHGNDALIDYQDDMIAPGELEKAVEHYMLHESQEADVMHDGEPVGRLVESFFLTPEKLQVMGLSASGAPKVGWWVGYKCHPEVYQKVKDRKLRMFSIYATAGQRVEA